MSDDNSQDRIVNALLISASAFLHALDIASTATARDLFVVEIEMRVDAI